MKHTLLAISLTIAALSVSAPAQAAPARVTARTPLCSYNWHTVTGVKRSIRCAVQHYSVPGGVPKAFAIARRESRFHYGARNHRSGACGVYQHMPRYWPGRWQNWGSGTTNNCYNGRSNVIVTIRMVHHGGWGPWGG